jgi:hypothetical protein
MSRFSRRRFVTAAGLLGGAAAAGPPAFLRRALAQSGVAPKRLLLFFMPNCSIRARWISQGGRNVEAGTGTASEFTMNTLTQPLADIRQHLTLIHGISMSNMRGDLHSSAQIRVTTGADVTMPSAGRGGGNLPGGPSLDTLAAEKSPVIKGTDTPFRQLVVSADSRGLSLHHQCVSSDLSNAFIPPESAPLAVFDRLFKDVNVGAGGADRAAALAQLRAKKKSVLDFMRSDLGRLERQVSSAQRPLLQSHVAAVASLEKTLTSPAGPNVTTGGPLPVIPAGLMANTSANHPQLMQGFFDIIRSAFMFDLTRVASMSFGTGNSAVSFADFGAGPSGGVHNISHQSQNTATMDSLSTITRWYLTRVKEFVLSLAAIPEPDGSAMLDNTLILLFSEVGQWHEHGDIPLVLMGGKNLGHTGGRALRYSRQVNDIGMAILKQLQVPMTTFGDTRWFKGAAPELFT